MAAAVPGTQLLISLLPRLFSQTSAAILGPTYGEYASAFTAAGRQVVEASRVAELRETPCAVICNPNNPDGRRFDSGKLLKLLRDRTARGLLVVDESFADLEGEDLSLAPHLPQAGLLILRSVSKTYGLGGLRLGFALTSPEAAASIRDALGPWPVSGPAIVIGLRTLADRAWLEAAKQRLAQDVNRLDAMLRGAVRPSSAGHCCFVSRRAPRRRTFSIASGRPGFSFAASTIAPPGSASAYRAARMSGGGSAPRCEAVCFCRACQGRCAMVAGLSANRRKAGFA